MESKYGFTKMSIAEFEAWIANQRVARTILTIQEHHTWLPNYGLFTGTNHFEMQRGMRNTHMGNGWADIGQHFTIFPDGAILTGRGLESNPACITGNNPHAICIENMGNFDIGKDVMRPEHKEAIVRATAAIAKKFGVPVNSDKIVYHHWFNLSTGERNNGTKMNKSCPGTNFFGGNSVAACEANFLPLVRAAMGAVPAASNNTILKYVCVTADTLNIRKQASGTAPKATDRAPATLGSILRVFKVQNNWYKISGSKQHWVSALYTKDVQRATVNADTLNVRSGAGTAFVKVGSFLKGQEVFIIEEANGWCKISMDEKWVKKSFLDFT